MLKRFAFLTGIAVSAALASGAGAQHRIDWYSLNGGGGEASGGGYKINGSIGQSVAGFTSNTTFLHWVGFWAGETRSPIVVTDIGALKKYADGTYVSIAGKIATSSEADFDGFFYMEDASRASGIRVAAEAAGVAGLLRGSVLNVIGTLGTTPAGERQITGPVVIITGTTTPLAPLGMTNRSVGGGNLGTPPLGQYGPTAGFGTNSVGLLVRTAGLVTGVEAGFVTIDDGSGTPVRVGVHNLAAPPALDDYVTIIGLSSLDKPGADRLRLVLPRDDADTLTH